MIWSEAGIQRQGYDQRGLSSGYLSKVACQNCVTNFEDSDRFSTWFVSAAVTKVLCGACMELFLVTGLLVGVESWLGHMVCVLVLFKRCLKVRVWCQIVRRVYLFD